MRPQLSSLALCTVALCACDSDAIVEDPEACSTGEVTVFSNLPTSKPVDADINLLGSAAHLDGAAIHKLWIRLERPDSTGVAARIPVKRDDENFASWSALVPVALMREYAVDNTVTLRVDVDETCEMAESVELGRLQLDPEAGIVVTDLALVVDYPNANIDALPATTGLKGVLEISAADTAAGVTVAVTGEGLQFPDVGSASVKLALEGDRARGLLSIRSEVPGSKLVIATAKDAVATSVIAVAGPPAISPLTWTLKPDASVPIAVGSQGGVASNIRCQASPHANLEVISGGVDLSVTPGGVDQDQDGRLDLTARALMTAVAGDSVSITCTDGFGQAGPAATITVEEG